ncbi:MAG: deoxyribodipyrimidine photo-lyase [Dehalococcoidia bacterium]|nr:MAG: deoxyribodipyrimidine photo-lyase [Dehalococcoidia bacterium]
MLWFRRDLRLHDLPALAAALAHERVAPLFVFDEALLAGRWRSPNRVAFLLGSLAVLAEELARRGSRLHLRWGRPVAVVPAFAREAGASVVYCSREYSPYGRRRDRAVAAALAAEGRTLTRLPGVLVHEPEAVRKADGSPYTVYTPFRKSWEQVPRRQPLPAPERLPPPPPLAAGTLPSLAELGLDTPSPQLPAPGEVAARQRLQRFLDEGLAHYAERRDLLAVAGTSRLSQDLRWGLLSPLEVVSRTQASPQFVAELLWREFYYSILFHFPEVVHQEFQARYRGLPWREAPAELAAWREGRTGYPLVDAGMRQLAATGYLHNRARMVVASFLTKHLLIDWRHGERHFMELLVDGDLANNNGGWQWTAGVGTDAAPYFRVFNPVAQGQRFDPEGAYVRQWVPELRRVPTAYIHQPWQMPREVQEASGCHLGRDYPFPLVDLEAGRARALAAYRLAPLEGA